VWAAFTSVPPGLNQPRSAWPGAYGNLPNVAFVIPYLCHNMHDCDIATGHQWLQANLSGNLDWVCTHNSLLVVTFDESDSQRGSNHIITLFDGAALRPGRFDEPIDQYRLPRTIEEIYHLPALGKAASTTPITDVWASSTH
jgi:hypothetical protein